MTTTTTAPRFEGMLVPRRPPSNRGTVIGDAHLSIDGDTQVFLCSDWGRLSYAGRVVGATTPDAGLGVVVEFDSDDSDTVVGVVTAHLPAVWVRLCPTWARGDGVIVWNADDRFGPPPGARRGYQVVAICLGFDPGGWDSWADVRLTRSTTWTD